MVIPHVSSDTVSGPTEVNRTKERLVRGDTTFGLFIVSGSSVVVEACTRLGYDWLLLDTEASPHGADGLVHQLQAMNGSLTTPLVRVGWLERHLIERTLDLGAHGILVPKVECAAMAEEAARYCRFPPEGARGVNPVRASGYFRDVPGYLASANGRTLCMVQIESPAAVAASEEIASVPGVDVLFIGPGDLASALGQPGVVTGPAMDHARAAVLRAVRAAGRAAGIFAYSLDLARQYVVEGFTFVALGNDIKLLTGGAMDALMSVSASRDSAPPVVA